MLSFHFPHTSRRKTRCTGRWGLIGAILAVAALIGAGPAATPGPAADREALSLVRLSSLLDSTATAVHAVPDTVDDPRPPLDADALAKSIHQNVNAARVRFNLSRLAWVDSLQELALVHSRDMAEREFFGHTNPSGETVNDRAQRLGYSCYRYVNDSTLAKGFGENLYRASRYTQYQKRFRDGRLVERVYTWKTPPQMAAEVVDGWLDSPPHRRNLLRPGYDTESIGVVVTDDDFYVTQVFC